MLLVHPVKGASGEFLPEKDTFHLFSVNSSVEKPLGMGRLGQLQGKDAGTPLVRWGGACQEERILKAGAAGHVPSGRSPGPDPAPAMSRPAG